MLKHQDVLILYDIYANAVAEENLIIYHNTTDVVSVYKEGEHLYSNEIYSTVGTTIKDQDMLKNSIGIVLVCPVILNCKNPKS